MISTRSKSKGSGKRNDQDPEARAKDSASSESKSDPDMYGGVHKSILEAFDNLNWEDSMPREQQRSYNRYWLPPEEKIESHAVKLIHSELKRFYTKEYSIPPWSEDESKKLFYVPGLKLNHQTILPKHSVLTQKEQWELYSFYCRMTIKNNKTPLDEKELVAFQELRTKAADEYAEFQEFAKSEWYKGQWQRVLEIPPQVDQFIESLWQMRMGQCLSYYPDEYKFSKQIPLTLHDPQGDNCVFEFVKHICTQGYPLKMGLVKIKKPMPLISEFEDLCRIKPVTSDIHSNPFLRSVFAVSHDRMVDTLLKRTDVNVDVVMSMSGMKTLVDNVKFQRDWILPITVKEVLKNDGESIRKVVIIDKNLPPNYMSVHEKNVWHAKIIAKWMLIQSNNPNIFKKKEVTTNSKKKDGESYEELLSEVVEKLNVAKSSGKVEGNSTESELGSASCKPEAKPPSRSCSKPRNKQGRELITFNDLPCGVETSPDAIKGHQNIFKTPEPRQNKRESCRKNVRKEDGALQEDNVNKRKRERQSLVSYDDPFTDFVDQGIDEFGVSTSAPKIKRTQDVKRNKIAFSEKAVHGTSAKIIQSNEQKEFSLNQPAEEGEIKHEADDTLRLSQTGSRGQCLQYEIWNIHKSKYVQFLKAEQRSLNVLVRTRRDGKLFHYENNTKKLEDACVSSKLEFQPEYGASKMTASELIREYLDLYMRPNSKLARVRSIGHTKEVMMTEVKTLAEVRTALQVEVYQMKKLFDPLYAVLTKLIDLPPGRYMLEHTVKMGPFAKLYSEAPGRTGFNLPQYCQELRKVDVNVPPLPIDPLVLSPLQLRDRLPPALFIPCWNPTPEVRNYFRKPNPPKKTNKKRKKKKNKCKEESVKDCNSGSERNLDYDSVDSLSVDSH